MLQLISREVLQYPKARWRESTYQNSETGKVLRVAIPPIAISGAGEDTGTIIYDELAESRMLIIMAKDRRRGGVNDLEM